MFTAISVFNMEILPGTLKRDGYTLAAGLAERQLIKAMREAGERLLDLPGIGISNAPLGTIPPHSGVNYGHHD
jgi:hypothetical protein